jgi:predicted SAM-dependent methyltransferase
MRPGGRGIKLHLGCGDYWFDGYLNIDLGMFGGTDMIWDLNKGLPFQNKVVGVIEMYDVLEHFGKEEVDRLLEEFKRVLIDGGKIRLSVPDLEKVLVDFKDDKPKMLHHIYGINSGDSHKYGYFKDTITKLFVDKGFKNVLAKQEELPERPGEPKIILEAVK